MVVGGVTTVFAGETFEWTGSTATMKKYYYAGQRRVAMRVDSTLYYLLTDHLGSTTVAAASDASLQSRQVYGLWGEVRGETGALPTSFQFTGQRKSELAGVHFFQARYYDSLAGVFLQPDSLVPDPYNPLDWNRFLYVRGNAVNGVDPSGHFTVLIGAAIGAIAGVAIVAATHPNLQASDYLAAATVGAAAGALISTGVGLGAETALGATLVGAGAGAATSAAGYTVTAGDCYNTLEMGANAGIGMVTGAASAFTGPAVVSANVAKSGTAILARAGINALGTQASQIVHNEYFDERTYPPGMDLVGAAMLGSSSSIVGEGADVFVNHAVTAISGNQVAGQVAGSVTYNLVRNFGSSIFVNQGLNFIEKKAE